MVKVLVTGGAGFVGSYIALAFADEGHDVTAVDNLSNPNSHRNIWRLKSGGVGWRNGPVGMICPKADWIIHCAADASTSLTDPSENITATIEALDKAKTWDAGIVYISTSRVYPIEPLRRIQLRKDCSRLDIHDGVRLPGYSYKGINEHFTLVGRRSLYGASKLAGELLVGEYPKSVILRCGIMAGPGQFGSTGRGIVAHMIQCKVLDRPFKYTSYGGYQVRDMLHPDDLQSLCATILEAPDSHWHQTYNVGGGRDNSFSLIELADMVGLHVDETEQVEGFNDIPWMILDTYRVSHATGWEPKKNAPTIVAEALSWVGENKGLFG